MKVKVKDLLKKRILSIAKYCLIILEIIQRYFTLAVRFLSLVSSNNKKVGPSSDLKITEKAIKIINDIQISTVSDAFYHVDESISIVNDDAKVSAIALKVLSEVYD